MNIIVIVILIAWGTQLKHSHDFITVVPAHAAASANVNSKQAPRSIRLPRQVKMIAEEVSN